MPDDKRKTPSLVDPSGKEISRSLTLWDKWRALSLRWQAVIITLAAFIISTGSVLSSLDTIKSWLPKKTEERVIHPISITLQNGGEEAVSVFRRGDFMLWLPGSTGKHMLGKYSLGSSQADSGIIVIDAGMQLTIEATVSNVNTFYPYYESGDYDLCLLYTSPSPRDRTRSRMPSSA